MTKTFDPTRAYALLIAVDQNQVTRWALPAVANDLRELKAVLLHPERCAYAEANIKVVMGAEATRRGILEGMKWLRDCLKKDADATVILYYTGHGAVEGGANYLIPFDMDEDNVPLTALRAQDFADAVGKITPERMFVALDCCHAEGMQVKDLAAATSVAPVPLGLFKVNGTSDAKALTPIAKGIDALENGSGRAVLNSCRAAESSYVYEDRKMSAFTYHLIEALTGHANPPEGATDVRVYDVLSYLDHKVPSEVAKRLRQSQHPEFEARGSFAVARLLGGKGLSKGSAAPEPGLANLPGPTMQASITGGGAIAQGAGARAVGAGGVMVGGDNSGNINTGSQTVNTGGGAFIGGGVGVGGDFVGRDKIVNNRRGDSIRMGDVNIGDGNKNLAIGVTGQVHQTSTETTTQYALPDLQKQLAELQAAIARLPAGDGSPAKAKTRVGDAQNALDENEPDGEIVTNRLGELENLIKKAGGVAGALGGLIPLVGKAMEMARQLFP